MFIQSLPVERGCCRFTDQGFIRSSSDSMSFSVVSVRIWNKVNGLEGSRVLTVHFKAAKVNEGAVLAVVIDIAKILTLVVANLLNVGKLHLHRVDDSIAVDIYRLSNKLFIQVTHCPCADNVVDTANYRSSHC